MKTILRSIGLLMLLGTGTLYASPALDKSYSLRTMVIAVINGDKEPVFSEHIENQLIKYVKTHSRFDFPNEAYLSFKNDIKDVYLFDSSVATREKLEWIRPQIDKLATQNVDGLILAEIFHFGERYRVSVVMTSLDNSYNRAKEVEVEDPTSMQSFTDALNRCLDDLVTRIPFDGTVVRRAGYRVVIDRVAPDVYKGQTIRAYTVEMRDNKFYLQETGQLSVREIGDTFTFADITVENKPLEVTTGNKVLLEVRGPKRDPAFEDLQSHFGNRQLGLVDLQLGMTAVTLNNRTVSGSGLTDSHGYTGGTLHGELWLSQHLFVDLGVDFGMGSLTASSTGQSTKLNSNISDIKSQLGYRFGLGDPRVGLTINGRVGFARHRVQVGLSSDPIGFYTSTYTGLVIGSGTVFPLSRKYGLGFDIDAYLLPSFSESPLDSGSSVNSISAWKFGFRGYYHFSDSIDILAKLAFDTYAAEFLGVGSRPVPLSSTSTNGRAIGIGAAYYF
jgi:hypothetical protein